LLILHNFSHLAGVAASPEIDENDDAVQEKNHTDAKKYNEVCLWGVPDCFGCSLYCWGKEVVGNPHVGNVETKRKYCYANDETKRPESGMSRQFERNNQNY
jgi:hypothetical protein